MGIIWIYFFNGWKFWGKIIKKKWDEEKKKKSESVVYLYTDYSWFNVSYITHFSHFDNNFGWLGWVNGVRSGKSFGSPEDTSIQNRKRCGVGVGPWLPELQAEGWSTAEAQRLRVNRWLLAVHITTVSAGSILFLGGIW